MVVVVGTIDDAFSENQRGVALFQHLFSQAKPIANVGLVLTASACEIFEPSSSGRFSHSVSIVDSVAAFEKLIPQGASLGVVSKELDLQQGDWATSFVAAIRTHQASDASAAVALLLSAKDEEGILCVKKACALLGKALKQVVVPHLEASPRAMSVIAEDIRQKLCRVNTIRSLETIADATAYELAFAPVTVHSGDEAFDLSKIVDGEPARDSPLQTDCVVIAFGCKHQGYCAHVGRTFFGATASQVVKDAYKFLLAVSDAAIDLLCPGTSFKDVYGAVMRTATTLNEGLAKQLSAPLGFGTGLLILDARHNINEKNAALVIPGMTLVIRLHLSVDNGTTKSSVLLSDTVVVQQAKGELITKQKRSLGDVLLQSPEQKVEKQKELAEKKAEKPSELADDGPRDLTKITRAAARGTDYNREEDRQVQLTQLMKEKHAEWEGAGRKNEIGDALEEYKTSELGLLGKNEASAYPTEKEFPEEAIHSNQPFLDKKRETLWLPLAGPGEPSSPFHVATISKMEQTSRGSVQTLTVTFHTTQESNLAFRSNRTKVFIKEATFTHTDANRFLALVTGVRTIQQSIKTRDQQRKESIGVVAQAGLKLEPRAAKLPDVKCRPPPVTGRSGCTGDLQVHTNGFRFQSHQCPPLDILYSNIKHIIFQPSKNDICVILHLVLKQPILLNKKKAEHIQFAAEVMETSEQMTVSRRTHEEELAAEEKERERIKMTNQQFAMFAKAASEKSGIATELGLKDVDFQGCPARSLCRVRASERCVWAVNELPLFALTLNEVEVASLERVVPNGATFDIFFVKKDYRTVVSILTIPLTKVEMIKDWLLQCKVVYFESTSNIQWSEMLKTIRGDPDWEPWGEAGWKEMIDPEADSDEEDSDDDDSDYEGDEEEEEEDEEVDSEEDSDWAEEVSEDSSVATDDTDEASGSSDDDDHWERMEKKLQEEDRRRGRDEDADSDDAPKRKRARVEPAARPAAPKSVPARGGVGTTRAKGGIAPVKKRA